MLVTLDNLTPNPEGFIAYIARVSNPENQDNPDYVKLIKYLIRNEHWSPFEHSYFTFEIVTSRAIAAQILRHRSFTFQEFSQRYAEAKEIEQIELRKQAKKNRQSSEEVFDPAIEYDFYTYATDDIERKNMIPVSISASTLVHDHVENLFTLYQNLLGLGVAKESARFVLPLATQTTLYMTGSVRSWIHYLRLRNDHHTQKEHQLIAQEIEKILREHLPSVFTALDEIKAEKVHWQSMMDVLKNRGITSADQLLAILLNSPVDAPVSLPEGLRDLET